MEIDTTKFDTYRPTRKDILKFDKFHWVWLILSTAIYIGIHIYFGQELAIWQIPLFMVGITGGMWAGSYLFARFSEGKMYKKGFAKEVNETCMVIFFAQYVLDIAYEAGIPQTPDIDNAIESINELKSLFNETYEKFGYTFNEVYAEWKKENADKIMAEIEENEVGR